jgi:hypothetical protein
MRSLILDNIDYSQETPKFSNLVVSGSAGGVIRVHTYFVIGFFLCFPHPAGVFHIIVLLIALLCSLTEILACFKIAFAGEGKKFSVMRAKIDLDPEETVHLVFSRHSYGKGKHSIDDYTDVTPKLLTDPDGMVGDLKISIGGKPLQVEGCRYQVIGFDRYRVSSCDGLLTPDSPHVSVPLAGGTEVYVIGRVKARDDGLILSKRYPVLIVEPKAINNFLRYNLIRTLLFCVMASLLVINW